ncbi:four-helix bundle copper-binding protein [Sporomusa ovata]
MMSMNGKFSKAHFQLCAQICDQCAQECAQTSAACAQINAEKWL